MNQPYKKALHKPEMMALKEHLDTTCNLEYESHEDHWSIYHYTLQKNGITFTIYLQCKNCGFLDQIEIHGNHNGKSNNMIITFDDFEDGQPINVFECMIDVLVKDIIMTNLNGSLHGYKDGRLN